MVFSCSFNHWTRLWWYCLTHQEQPKHNFSVLPVQLWLVKCLQMELDKVWCASWELLLRSVPSKFSLGLLGAVRHARHQGGAQPCRAEWMGVWAPTVSSMAMPKQTPIPALRAKTLLHPAGAAQWRVAATHPSVPQSDASLRFHGWEGSVEGGGWGCLVRWGKPAPGPPHGGRWTCLSAQLAWYHPFSF